MRLTAPGRARAALGGMTLIELMIGLAIAAILMLLAAPAYRDFIANTNVRNAAENTVAGLRRANAEAVKRNAPVQFTLSNAGWSIDEVDPADGSVANAIESYKFSEGAAKASIDSLGGGTAVTFNGLGRVLGANYDGAKLITDIQFTTTMTSDPRVLHVVVGNDKSATGIRICDTKFAFDDPAGCPKDITNR
jgi:type IV fimbrial biogenesis protein FimT